MGIDHAVPLVEEDGDPSRGEVRESSVLTTQVLEATRPLRHCAQKKALLPFIY